MILPTSTTGQNSSFTTAKGNTVGAFIDYAMCQGQDTMGALGYSPMPINLVQAAFNQVPKIPGASGQHLPISQCHNPTFTASGVNLLALHAPYPPACDRAGPVQCSAGTGGAHQATAPSRSAGTTRASGGSASVGGAAATSQSTGASASSTGATAAGTSGSTAPIVAKGSARSSATTAAGSAATGAQQCNPDTGTCSASAGSSSNGDGTSQALQAAADPQTLPAKSAWGSTQTLMVVAGFLLLALVLGPGIVARRLRRQP